MRSPIRRPCDRRWSELDGRGPVRRCSACDRDVTDLSATSGWRARLFLAANPTACVRAPVGPDGGVRHRPSRLRAVVVAIVGLALSPAEVALAEPPAAEAATGSLRITVLDETGLPVPNTRLELTIGGVTTIGTTDDAGEFLFVGLAPGVAELAVEGPGRTGTAGATGIALKAGVVASHVFELGPAYELGGISAGGSTAPTVAEAVAGWFPQGPSSVVVEGAHRWKRAVARCGTLFGRRTEVIGGSARLDHLPDDANCRIRVEGGAPAVVTEVPAGAGVRVIRP